jgi:uncharacterized protein (DUF3084 family)
MSKEAESLQSAINDLVTSKLLSLEAVDIVNRIKANAAEVEASNTMLLDRNNALTAENAKVRSTNDALQTKVSAIDAREAAIVKREAAMFELEKAKAVAEARAETIRSCFDTVFRNFTVNKSTLDNVVVPSNIPGNYATQHQLSKTTTETVS